MHNLRGVYRGYFERELFYVDLKSKVKKFQVACVGMYEFQANYLKRGLSDHSC